MAKTPKANSSPAEGTRDPLSRSLRASFLSRTLRLKHAAEGAPPKSVKPSPAKPKAEKPKPKAKSEAAKSRGPKPGEEAAAFALRPHVRLAAGGPSVPAALLVGGERVGALTSFAGHHGFAIVRKEVLANEAGLSLADGTSVELLAVPELTRPLGRP